MELGLEALSKITVFSKYAKFKKELNRRETWEEIIDRYQNMMVKKYPSLKEAIIESAKAIREKKVLPSMRALQFAGPAAEVNNARIYNCCYLPIDSLYSFSESMFLLLGGTGVGYSVQKQHVAKLPTIVKQDTFKTKNYLIEDSIMGWGDAVKVLMKFYFKGGSKPEFDFRAIREKGAELVTAGGKAPGPEPLRIALQHIDNIMNTKEDGSKLTPLECHDILCHIANSVLSGGIRRSAMISLFSHDDDAMINCKSSAVSSILLSKEHPKYTSKDGLEDDLSKYLITIQQGKYIYRDIVVHIDLDSGKFWDLEQLERDGTVGWWVCNEQRGRSNNSATLERGVITEQMFLDLWKRVEESGSGEPGLYWTNNLDNGTNPCCEIALLPYQFCNLCEINASDIESQVDLNSRVAVAAFFGTLQAGFTDFHYLRPIWSQTTQKEALLGIGMTGIGSGEILKYDLKLAADIAVGVNQVIAEKIGINEAARVTCIKPSGTTSCVLGTSSGIHAWHAEYYLRTMRFNKNEAIATYLAINHPELCEDDKLRPNDTLCVRIPIKAPEKSILRTETSLETLERVKKFSLEWIKQGHIKGDNTHNVSATVSIHDEKWPEVGDWMWKNREVYNGLSVLNHHGGSYIQAPFEDITKEEYDIRISKLHSLDLRNVIEMNDEVDFGSIQACAGGSCEIEI